MDKGADAHGHLGTAEGGHFGDSGATVIHGQQEGMIPSSDPRRAIGRREDGLDFLAGQIPNQLLILAFDGNRQDTRDEIHPLGIAERDKPKKAPNGREANVPGTDGIAPVLLQMGEKGENGGDVKLRETEGGGLDLFGVFDKQE